MMNKNLKIVALGLMGTLLVSCAQIPTGPHTMALPGTGKSFDQFRADDADCRNYAQLQSGGKTAQEANNNAMVGTAVLGTAIGTLVGAAIDGHRGAAGGAATGLVTGTAIGANQGALSAHATQQLYDNAYTQCMYAKGEQVQGHYVSPPAQYTAPPPQVPPTNYAPPPPPPPARH